MVCLTREGSPREDPRSPLSDATRAPRIARRRAPFVPPSPRRGSNRVKAPWSIARAAPRHIAPLTDPSRVVALFSATQPPPRFSPQGDEDPTEKFSLELETKQLGELQESRDELLSRVSHLKRDLQEWRFKLDNQVKSYRSELGDLRKTLNSEVTQLRDEFADLRQTLKQQLEATAEMAAEEKEDDDDDA
jgi:hypothetical protein